MLKNITKRLDMVSVAMDTFNRTTDIQELYTSIKQNMVDPICYDAVNPGSQNKYCVLSGVTLSQCTRTLLKIFRDMVPLFHAIGMPVSYTEIKGIKRQKEKYTRLCRLFEEGQLAVNSLPKGKKKLQRKPTSFDTDIGKAVQDVEPDFKHTIAVLIHKMRKTGQTEGEVMAEFVRDVQVRIPQEGQGRQKAGGYGDEWEGYDPRDDERRGFGYGGPDRQPSGRGRHSGPYEPSSPGYPPPGGPTFVPRRQHFFPPGASAPGPPLQPAMPPPLDPPPPSVVAENERKRLIQRIQTLKSQYNHHHLKIWSEQDRRYKGLVKKADTLKTRMEDRKAAIEASLEWTEIFTIGGIVGNSLLLSMAGGLAYTMYAYNAAMIELERKRNETTTGPAAPYCWSQTYGSMMPCNDPMLMAETENTGKVPSFLEASQQFIKNNPLLIAGLLSLQIGFLIIRYRSILNERRAAAPAHLDMLTDMLEHLETYKDRLKGMGYCVPPIQPEGYKRCPPQAGIHHLHSIDDAEAQAACEELGCTWGDSVAMMTSIQYHLGDLGKRIAANTEMDDHAVVTELDVTVNIFEGILAQVRSVSHSNLQESIDQLKTIEKSFKEMKYELLSFNLIKYLQSPHVAMSLWICYQTLTMYHEQKVAEAIMQNNLSHLVLTTGAALLTGNLGGTVDGVAAIQGVRLDYERDRARIQTESRNRMANQAATMFVQGDQFQLGIPRDAFATDQRAADRYHAEQTRMAGVWRDLAKSAVPHVEAYVAAAQAEPKKKKKDGETPAGQDLGAAPPDGAVERIVAQEATIAKLQERLDKLEAAAEGPRTPPIDPRFDQFPGNM